jgi:hypothetical protein
MSPPSLTPTPWHRVTFGERVALDMVTAVLWPLRDDERMTVLINILAAQIGDSVEEERIDGLIEMLRMQLKAELAQ